jgi:hypothetical protein
VGVSPSREQLSQRSRAEASSESANRSLFNHNFALHREADIDARKPSALYQGKAPQARPPTTASNDASARRAFRPRELGQEDNVSLPPSKQSVHSSAVAEEEQKLRMATFNLVVWLQNRLRSRMDEVADLETKMVAMRQVLSNIDERKRNASSEREVEIRGKIESQKQLADFRRKEEAPREVYKSITDEAHKLETELDELSKTYRALSQTYVDLQMKIHDAGFAHWLDARGRAFMPETAVAVLSKSVGMWNPVVHGIEKAVEIDRKLVDGVEKYVPMPPSPLFDGVLSDVLILIPVIPILALLVRLSYSIRELSVIHHIVLLAGMFAAQGAVCFTLSLVFAEDALRHLQRSNDTVLIGAMFASATAYIMFMLLLTLICAAENEAEGFLQLFLCAGAGTYFYRTAFRPSVLNRPVAVPAIYYVLCSVLFLYVASERNRATGLRFPLHGELNEFLGLVKAWLRDTATAMALLVLGRGAGAHVSGVATATLARVPARGAREGDARAPRVREAASPDGGRPHAGAGSCLERAERLLSGGARGPGLPSRAPASRYAERIQMAGRFAPPFPALKRPPAGNCRV